MSSPYYKPEWAQYVKLILDYFYDETNKENYDRILVFNYKLLNCAPVTAYARIAQGGNYLVENIDASYSKKLRNLKVERKGKHVMRLYLRDSRRLAEMRGSALFAATTATALVAADNSKVDALKTVVQDEESGEDIAVDTAIGGAEWKEQLFNFIESSSLGDKFLLTNLKITPELLAAVEYYLNEVGGEGEFTILNASGTTINILHGMIEKNQQVGNIREVGDNEVKKQEVVGSEALINLNTTTTREVVKEGE